MICTCDGCNKPVTIEISRDRAESMAQELDHDDVEWLQSVIAEALEGER